MKFGMHVYAVYIKWDFDFEDHTFRSEAFMKKVL